MQGVFCGDCLFMRYGENNILEVEAAGAWECPPCRGLCNCSFHRIRRGWAPTGTLYRRAIAEGAFAPALLHAAPVSSACWHAVGREGTLFWRCCQWSPGASSALWHPC